MPATPPTIHTPPGAVTPASPGAVHSPPSAAPAVPGGVVTVPTPAPAVPGGIHFIPSVGGVESITSSVPLTETNTYTNCPTLFLGGLFNGRKFYISSGGVFGESGWGCAWFTGPGRWEVFYATGGESGWFASSSSTDVATPNLATFSPASAGSGTPVWVLTTGLQVPATVTPNRFPPAILITGALTKGGLPVLFPPLPFIYMNEGRPSYYLENEAGEYTCTFTGIRWEIAHYGLEAYWYSGQLPNDHPALLTEWIPITSESGTPVVTAGALTPPAVTP